jgi:hypothetical protein
MRLSSKSGTAPAPAPAGASAHSGRRTLRALVVIGAGAVVALHLAWPGWGSRPELLLTPTEDRAPGPAVPSQVRPVVHPVAQPVSAEAGDETAIRLLTYIATRSRLQAEREGRSRLMLPAKFSKTSRYAKRIAANEERLFEARRKAFDSRERDFRQKIAVVRAEIAGFATQRNAKEKEISLIDEELRTIEKLHARQLTNVTRLLSLKREKTRAQWDIGSLESSVARSELTIKDIEQQIHENRHNVAVEAERDIRALDIEIGTVADQADDLPQPLVELATEVTRR